MAKFTPLLGNISGKIAGNVFARNRGGFYIRSFRSPVNPNTSLQSAARSRFAGAIGSWHSLDDSYKSNWNSFATNFFKPKFPVLGVTYSGFNAHTSLKNQLNSMVTYGMAPTLTGLTATYAPFDNLTLLPPSNALSGNILIDGIGPDGEDVAASLVTSFVELNTGATNLNFTLNLSTGYTATNPPKFRDAVSGEVLGLVFMMGLPGTQANQFGKNPKYMVVAATQQITISAATSPSNSIAGTVPTWLYSTKNMPAVGEYVTITAFLVGTSGQTYNIGSTRALVNA